jgi:RimJ/RimL family protein N-acetyltransferase
MTEAVAAITEWAFARFGLTRVFAVVFERNAASRRVLEKAGFALEGRLRRSAIKDGRVLDEVVYARVRDEPANGLS